MMMQRTVFITGASSGIGKAQALAFLAQGDRVIGFDVQERQIEHPAYAHYIGDVRSEVDVQRALPDQVDVLLNTAGILDDYTPSHLTDLALWQRIMDTNVLGLYLVTNAVLPKMLANERGVIINMASIAGLLAGGGGAAYTTSKHAIIGYTKQLAYDYADHGIRVNAIAPGAIQTPMNAKDFAGDAHMAKWVAEQTPAKRWAQPEEIAQASVFLASDAAAYMHGSVLTIDGGWSIK